MSGIMNKHELSLNISLDLKQWAYLNELDDKISVLEKLPQNDDIRLAVLAAEGGGSINDIYELMKKYYEILNTPFTMTPESFKQFIAVLVKHSIIPQPKK